MIGRSVEEVVTLVGLDQEVGDSGEREMTPYGESSQNGF
jgi:hypothetical protein